MQAARARLAAAGFAAADVDATGRVAFFCGSFAHIGEALASLPAAWTLASGAAPLLDGVLLDSGLSAAVRGQPWRGLSFRVDGPLDMRVGSAAAPAPAAAAALRAALAARAAAGEAAPAADAEVDGEDAAAAAAAAAPSAVGGDVPVTASELVSSLDVAPLAGLIHGFGGLEPSRAIAVAQAIVRWRGRGPRERRRVASSLELRFALEQGLAALDGAALPGTNGVLAVKARRWATRRRRDADLAAMARNHPKFPAETGALFAALRMAVNGEIEAVAAALTALPAHLAPGAAVAALTFQPAEDAVVEAAFAALAASAPASAPAPAGAVAAAFAVESGATPVRAAAAERRGNPRAAAARLRVLRRSPAVDASAAADAAWVREAQASVSSVLEAVAPAPQLPAFALSALEKVQAEAAARAAARVAQAEAAAAAPAAAPPAAASRGGSAAAGPLKVVQATGSLAPRVKATASAGAAQARPRSAATAQSASGASAAAEPGAAELAAFRAAAAAAAARRAAAAASSGAAAPARGGISLGRSGASSGLARASHARALHTSAAAGAGRRRGDAGAAVDARTAALLRGGRNRTSAFLRPGAQPSASASGPDFDALSDEDAIAAMLAEIRSAGSGGAVGAAHAAVPGSAAADAALARLEAGEDLSEAEINAALASLRGQLRAAADPDVVDADAVAAASAAAADAADTAAERLGLPDDDAARSMDEAMKRAESQLRRGVPLEDLEDADLEELLQMDLGGVHGRRYRPEVQDRAAAAAGAPPSDLWIDDALELAKLGTMEAACIAVARAQVLAAALQADSDLAEQEVTGMIAAAVPRGELGVFVAQHVSDAQAAALEGDPEYEAKVEELEQQAMSAAMLRFGAVRFPEKTRAALALRIAAATATAKAERLAETYAEDVAVGRGHFEARLNAILAGTHDDGVGSELRAALAARHRALEPLWRLPEVRASLEQRGLPLAPIGDEELRDAALELHVLTEELVAEPAAARAEEALGKRLASAASREPTLAPLLQELRAYAAAEGMGLQDAAVTMTAHAISAARDAEEVAAAMAEPSDPNKPDTVVEAMAAAIDERGAGKAAAAAGGAKAAGGPLPRSAEDAIDELVALLERKAPATEKPQAQARAMALLAVIEGEHGRQEELRSDVGEFFAAADDDGDAASAGDDDEDKEKDDVPTNVLASLRRLQGESGVDQTAVAEVLSLLDIEGAGEAARMHAEHDREVAAFRADMEAGVRADAANLEAERASGLDAEAAAMSPEEWTKYLAEWKAEESASVEAEVAKYARQLAQQRADFIAERREQLFGEDGEEDDGQGARGDVSDSGSDDDDDIVGADGAEQDENAGFYWDVDSDDEEAFVVGPRLLRALGITRRQLNEDVGRAIAYRKAAIGSCSTKDEEDSDDEAVELMEADEALAEREDGDAAALAEVSQDRDLVALARQRRMRPADLLDAVGDSDDDADEADVDLELAGVSDAYQAKVLQRMDAEERREASAALEERRLAAEVLRQLRALPPSVNVADAKDLQAAAARGLFTPHVAHALGVGPDPDAERGSDGDEGSDSDGLDTSDDNELLSLTAGSSASSASAAAAEGKGKREGKRPAAAVDESGLPLHPAQVLPLPRMRGAHAPPKLPLSRPGVSAGLIAKLDFMEDKPASLAAGTVVYAGRAAALNEGAGAVKRFDPHASIEALAAHNPLAASTAGVQFPLASLAKVSEAVNFDVGSTGRRAIASAVHRRLLFQQERAAGSQARRLRTLLMRRVGVSRTTGSKLSKSQADALAAFIVARRNEDPVLEDARSSASRARATASPVAVPHNPPRSHVLGGVGAAGGAGAALAHLPAGALPRAAALSSAYSDLGKRSEMRSGLKQALLRERRIKDALEKRRRPASGRFAARAPAAGNNYGYGPDSSAAAAGGAGQLK